MGRLDLVFSAPFTFALCWAMTLLCYAVKDTHCANMRTYSFFFFLFNNKRIYNEVTASCSKRKLVFVLIRSNYLTGRNLKKHLRQELESQEIHSEWTELSSILINIIFLCLIWCLNRNKNSQFYLSAFVCKTQGCRWRVLIGCKYCNQPISRRIPSMALSFVQWP